MSDNKTTMNCSGTFLVLLTVLFVGLKLTNNIDWSWWWVLSPIWIGLIIDLVVIIAVVIWLKKE